MKYVVTIELETAAQRKPNMIKVELKIKATHGTSPWFRIVNIDGALFTSAMVQSVSEARRRNDRADAIDETEMAIVAVTGRMRILTLLITMTKGERPVPARPLVRRGSLYGTMSPMANELRMYKLAV